jgi:hypothetical protein
MAVATALIKRLTTGTAVTALAGGRIGVRLAEGQAMPAVALRVVSVTPVHAMQSDDTLRRSRVQVDSFATSYIAAKNLSEAVNARLSRFSGTVTGQVIQDISYQNEIDLEEERGEDARMWRIMQDYFVWHEA